jgi:hypothetical protein
LSFSLAPNGSEAVSAKPIRLAKRSRQLTCSLRDIKTQHIAWLPIPTETLTASFAGIFYIRAKTRNQRYAAWNQLETRQQLDRIENTLRFNNF